MGHIHGFVYCSGNSLNKSDYFSPPLTCILPQSCKLGEQWKLVNMMICNQLKMFCQPQNIPLSANWSNACFGLLITPIHGSLLYCFIL